MTSATLTAIRAIIEADPTATKGERDAVLAVASGKTAAHMTDQRPLDRIISTKQAAEILGCSVQTVRSYCRVGSLHRVKANGMSRARGISEASLRAFMAGETTAKAGRKERAA